MFKFEHIEYLQLLWLIPVMIIIYIMMLRWRKKAFSRFAELNLLQKIMPNLSERKTRLKVWLQIIVFALVVIAMANPQLGSKLEEVKREGIDLMIALDVSNSMNAEDLQPNRLERAKQIITKIVDNLKGDRIGIIVFAGEAYIQLPITSDYAAAKLFLNTINTGYIPTQGTAIGNAIELATKSLTAREEEQQRSKVILVITDGENHEDDAISAAKNASENGIIIHTMGFGSPNGVPIPVYKNNKMVGYKTDKDGNTVITKLNESLLQQIASIGNGIYIRGTNSNASLNSFLDEINKLEKTELASQIFTEYESRFQYLIALALILLTIEYFIPRIKSKWIAQINLFGDKK
ncbi:MAG: vWA domain-containing protein [Bacteroidia bacterium]